MKTILITIDKETWIPFFRLPHSSQCPFYPQLTTRNSQLATRNP